MLQMKKSILMLFTLLALITFTFPSCQKDLASENEYELSRLNTNPELLKKKVERDLLETMRNYLDVTGYQVIETSLALSPTQVRFQIICDSLHRPQWIYNDSTAVLHQ